MAADDWKSRATRVSDDAPSSDWRSRATRIETAPAADDSWKTEMKTEDPSDSGLIPGIARGSKADSALSGVGQGLSGGWADEIGGYAMAGGRAVGRAVGLEDDSDEKTFGELYREERGQLRNANSRAQSANPWSHAAGQLGGDAVSTATLALGTGGASLTPAGQALQGGLSGLGNSNADVTRGGASNYGRAALDTGVSAGLSYGVTKAGARFADWIKARAAKGVQAAEDLANSQAGRKVDRGIDSLRGAYGGEVQKGSRYLENIGREHANVSPALQSQADALVSSGSPQALRESVFANTLEAIPGQSAKINTAKEALEAAAQSRDADVAREAAEILRDPVKRQLTPRLTKFLIDRAAPAALASLGLGTFTGPWGGLAGAVTGGLASTFMGKPSKALEYAARHPSVRKAGWQAISSTAAVPRAAGLAGASVARTEAAEESPLRRYLRQLLDEDEKAGE